MAFVPADTPLVAQPAPRFFVRRTASIARHANRRFILVAAAGFGAMLLWAGSTSIEQVTKAPGRIIPTVENQNVQHMEGGIVSEILVHEGDDVTAGDVLVRIQNSFNVAELQQSRVDLAAETIRSARLRAEASGQATFKPSAEDLAQYPDLVANETQLFTSQRASLDAQLAVFDDQITQQGLLLTQKQTRLANKRQEFDLMQQQVDSLTNLVKQGAASRNTLLERQSQLQQIRTDIDDLQLQIPQDQSALEELKRRRDGTDLQFRSDADKDRADSEVKIAKLTSSITAMQDRSQRTNVVAPVTGRVNRLLVNTVGGVVQPGQSLLQIVPSDASVSVEARVAPKDRGEIYPGLAAVIKISAYDYSRYGGLKGKIVEISPDALQDDKGEPYFRVRIEAGAEGFGPDHPIVPGMSAEVNILTGSNTVLDYLLKPVRKISENAFRQ